MSRDCMGDDCAAAGVSSFWATVRHSKVSKKKIVACVVAVAVIVAALLSPGIEGLSCEGKMTLAILVFGVVLWVTEVIPLPATALLVLVLMPVTGVCSYDDAFSHCVSSTVFFLLAPFAFTAALDATSIPTRIASGVLSWSGANSKKMLLGFMGAVALLSMVMSDVAACGVFVSVGKRLLELNGSEKGSSTLGKALMIGIPWASYAGGCAIMTGNGCNVLAVELFDQFFGVRVTFVDWMLLGVPVAVVMFLVSWFVLVRFFKPEPIRREAVEATLVEADGLGSLTRAERMTLVVIGCAIFAWILSSWIPFLNTAFVAIVAVIALSVPGCCALGFKELVARMNWGVILMIMCVLSVSHFVVETGAGEWVVHAVVGGIPQEAQVPLVVLAVASVAGCLVHNIVPVGPAVAGILAFPCGMLASQFGISVSAMVVVVAWQASISYLLPLDCVPILTYSCGYYKMSDMVKIGWAPSLVLIALSVLLVPLLCFSFGLS